MKTSSTKRVLAFWLAVAMLGSSAPAAFAANMKTIQPTKQVIGAGTVKNSKAGTGTGAPTGSLTVTEKENHGLKQLTVGQAVSDVEISSLVTVSKAGKGQDTYTYQVSDLPEGLSVSGNKISGTPKQAGSGQITVTVTDSSNSVSGQGKVSYIVKAKEVKAKEIQLKSATIGENIYDGTTDVKNISVQFSDGTNKTSGRQDTLSDIILTESEYKASGKFTNSNAGSSVSATITVTLTDEGKKKYIFADSKDTATIQTTGEIKKAPLTVTVPKITVQKDAGLSAVEKELQKIQANGVGNEKVSGTFTLTKVTPNGKNTLASSSVEDFTKTAGDYTVTATFTPTSPNDTQNYNPKEDVEFNCKVEGDDTSTVVQTIQVTSVSVPEKTYDKTNNITGEIVVHFSTADKSTVSLVKGADYTVSGTFDNTDAGSTVPATITVTLTEAGKKKYIFGENKTEVQVQANSVINKAPLTVTVPKITVQKEAGLEAVKNKLTNIQADGISEKVSGTFTLTKVTSNGKNTPASSSVEDFTKTAGNYTVTATFAPSNQNYNEKTDVTFECVVEESTSSQKQDQQATFTSTDAQVYEENLKFANPVKITAGNTEGAVQYDSSVKTVATIDSAGTISVLGVGETEISAVLPANDQYNETRISYKLVVNQGEYSGQKIQEKSVLKNNTHTFNLPEEIEKLDGVSVASQIDVPSDGSVVKEAKVSGKVLTVITKPDAQGKQSLVLNVSCKNYKNFGVTYDLTVVEKKNVSDQIVFEDKTVVYDGNWKTLDKASLAGADPKKWTYTWTQADTRAIEQTEPQPPTFKDIGVYKVTATYEDDKNWGQKTATLTIQEKPTVKSALTIDADQIDKKYDENYNNFNIKKRDESDGYTRLRVDATDNLDRQDIHNTYSEWIGMEITPKKDKGAVNVEDLYVSRNGTTWGKLTKDTYGDFFIDSVSGNSFYLWYDTDDRDRADSIYLATDAKGSNKFEIRVDFDAYSSSSSGGSSSGSSSTNKVDGQKVSTTTIDRSPSVSGSSASVSISSSALSDALEKNKKEAKHENADKTFIELDVKTSRSVDDTTVTVPVKSLDKIAKEDTGLSVVTNQGTLQLDHRALSRIADVAGKSDVSIALEEDNKDQYTLMIKDGSSKIIDLGSGDAEITFSYKLKSGERASDVKVYRVGDGSRTWLSTYGGSTVYGGTGAYAAATGDYVTNMGGEYSSSKKKITFSTDALGTFLVTTDNLQTGNNSGSSNTNPSYTTFVDVPAYRWSAPYINKLASLGVINGTGGGYFEPTLYVTREEFVKMLAGVARANVSGYGASSFPDVSAYRWSAPYIEWAVSHGITTGTDGGRFAPTMKITREEMATMIYRYTQSAGKTLPNKNVPTSFADAYQIDSWAVTPVSVMQQAGIIDGNVNNGRYTFDPKVPATREECAKMLSILYDLI